MNQSARNVTLADLAPVLAGIGKTTATGLVRLKDDGNVVFRVDLADGSAVVLKTFDDRIVKAIKDEACAAGLLDGVDLPLTQFLLVDETYERLPFRFAITNHLPGEPVTAHRDAPDVPDAYREMGRALRQLHTVRLPAYGRFSDGTLSAPVATNAEAVRRRITHAFGQFRRYGADEHLASALEAMVERDFDAATWSAGATFAHDDLQPYNVLVQRDATGRLRLSGVIDFGNAFAGDAVSDLAKTLFCSEHDAPGSGPHILDGYGLIQHPDPQRALQFYLLLHRVTMWMWLRHTGFIPDGETGDLITDLEAMVDAQAA